MKSRPTVTAAELRSYTPKILRGTGRRGMLAVTKKGQVTAFLISRERVMGMIKRLSENVAAGILACRGGRHLAARKNHPPVETPAFHHNFLRNDAVPPGWKPRLYVSQDGRRYHFQTGSKTMEILSNPEAMKTKS